MEYLSLDLAVNPWEGRSFEIIAHVENDSARQVVRFPLSQAALNSRLPALRRALAQLALRSDPLEVYRAQLETWGRIFHLE